jgi:SAM domain (Sterile alpha motif)
VSAIDHWLASLGMSEHAERFAENRIDISVLRHLTDQDLREIGVPLGHRRKMLAAIGESGGAMVRCPAAGTAAMLAKTLPVPTMKPTKRPAKSRISGTYESTSSSSLFASAKNIAAGGAEAQSGSPASALWSVPFKRRMAASALRRATDIWLSAEINQYTPERAPNATVRPR